MGPKKRKASDLDDKQVCKACGWAGKSIRTHLARTLKNCGIEYTEKDLSDLQDASSQKSKAKQKKYNAFNIRTFRI